ncbi:MAG: CpsD/CapB family tyrosine-protein kinase [Planctomycetota bacterium]
MSAVPEPTSEVRAPSTTGWRRRFAVLLGGLVGRGKEAQYRRRDLNLLALHGLQSPQVRFEDERTVSECLEHFRRLASWLGSGLRPGERRAIGIASPEPQAGATFVASNVAATLAHQHPDHRVLLSELNWRSPCLRASFSPDDPIGLRELLFYASGGTADQLTASARFDARLGDHGNEPDDEFAGELESTLTGDLGRAEIAELYPSIRSYLTGESDLDELAIQTPLENLVVHVSGGVRHDILSGAEQKRIAEYFRACLQQFDFVIADLPPVLPFADSELFSPYLDGALLVTRAGHTRRNELEELISQWRGAPLLGCVLNDEIRPSSWAKR